MTSLSKNNRHILLFSSFIVAVRAKKNFYNQHSTTNRMISNLIKFARISNLSVCCKYCFWKEKGDMNLKGQRKVEN